MTRRGVRPGFTLIELMIVVSILGVLAAIAIPAFRTVMFRAKTAEATGNLSLLFKGAAAYYNGERAAIGQTGQQLRACTVADVDSMAYDIPGSQKHRMSSDPSFQALAFKIGDYVFYSYGVMSGTGGVSACDVAPSSASVYTFYANGDLDGDGSFSTFELAVGSDSNNELYHGRGVYIMNELE